MHSLLFLFSASKLYALYIRVNCKAVVGTVFEGYLRSGMGRAGTVLKMVD